MESELELDFNSIQDSSRAKRTRGRTTTIRRRRLRTSDPRDYNCRIVRFCLCVRETLRVPDDE